MIPKNVINTRGIGKWMGQVLMPEPNYKCLNQVNNVSHVVLKTDLNSFAKPLPPTGKNGTHVGIRRIH